MLMLYFSWQSSAHQSVSMGSVLTEIPAHAMMDGLERPVTKNSRESLVHHLTLLPLLYAYWNFYDYSSFFFYDHTSAKSSGSSTGVIAGVVVAVIVCAALAVAVAVVVYFAVYKKRGHRKRQDL